MIFTKRNFFIFLALLLTIGSIFFISNTPLFLEQKVEKQVIVESTSTKKNIPKKLEISNSTPDFSSITNVKEKKAKFFNFLYPMIVNTNIEILQKRRIVRQSKSLNSEILEICSYYRIKCTEESYKTQFLNKVNIIPASLTLAQAANESAWGTSRFARKANNYFGQWCFTKGCGLVPKQRNSGASHEVKNFDNVNQAIRGYIRNLNSHPAYKELRNIRLQKSTFKGKDLAEGLSKYSERGQHYIEEITDMISYNKLNEYDTKMLNYLGVNK